MRREKPISEDSLLIDPYREERYARCYATLGTPWYLSAWETWVVRRPIPGSSAEDALSLYPACRLVPQASPSSLQQGLEALRQEGVVSLTVITDVFVDPHGLCEASDFHRPFKTHYLVDLHQPDALVFSRHHQEEIRRAACDVRIVPFKDHIEEWMALYQCLIQRHGIPEKEALSLAHFEQLAEVPQLVAVGGFVKDQLVSMHLWFHDGVYGFSHLAASHPLGYETGAAYLVNQESLHFFASHPQYHFKKVDLGGTPGTTDNSLGGLAKFKKGFSNASSPVYLCGYILDPEAYMALCSQSSSQNDPSYFPAYRPG